MNFFNIRRTFIDKKRRGWEKIYIAIDLHETLIEGKYNKFNEGAEIYPYAKEFFEWANHRDDIVLILWTSSHKESLDEILPRLEKDGIKFNYINENPECESTELCDFKNKFYFNILLDDKAGFQGETDWQFVINELKAIGEWDNQ